MARPFSPPSLIALLAEADRRAPGRRRTSDGWLGDAAHRARRSAHNPLPDGAVLARDLSHDPEGGLDAHALADAIVARQDPRVSLVISRGRIASARRVGVHRAWTWRRYTGANRHDTHAHIEAHNTASARNDTSPWWPDDEHEEDEMASIDYRRGLVRQLYLQLFGRHPESPAVQEHWADHIRVHGYDATVVALADSDEAKARRG